ncbi:hypothetical protein HK096_002228 [Nowakowskiella sp. JEL0078]|nr:hypothetical protein HK096_002228 [Nowakowskiella sp. JEL0078]
MTRTKETRGRKARNVKKASNPLAIHKPNMKKRAEKIRNETALEDLNSATKEIALLVNTKRITRSDIALGNIMDSLNLSSTGTRKSKTEMEIERVMLEKQKEYERTNINMESALELMKGL